MGHNMFLVHLLPGVVNLEVLWKSFEIIELNPRIVWFGKDL